MPHRIMWHVLCLSESASHNRDGHLGYRTYDAWMQRDDVQTPHGDARMQHDTSTTFSEYIIPHIRHNVP